MYKILLIIAVFACAKVKLEVLVVELPAETGNTPQETIKKNIERYAKHLETIRHHIGRGVNIVVFPEYGLTGLNPNVEESAQFIPDMYQSHSGLPDNIKQLSDLAISSGVHLVVNMLEMDNSTNTKRYYNTLVVFDTYGRIIAKARKFNLTPKEKMKLTPGTSVATFTFYLYQFCLLIGEDILTLEAFNNVNTFAGVIISSSWQNTLPSNLATSIAYGYFKRTKTKVFYSNLNNPEEGISGSGLYSEEKVDAEMTGTSRTIMKYGLYFPGMLFPYNSNQHEKANEELTTLGKSERFANEDPISGLKLITQLPETVKKTPAIKNTIINDYGRCTLVTTTDLSTVYQLIAYETIERIGSRDYLSYFCGIIPTDTNLRTKTNVTLEKVTITIQPKTTEKIITLPIVADYNFLPADFSYNVSDGTVATIQDKRDIIVFGIRTLKPITIINIGTASIFVAPTKSAQQTIKTNIEKYSLRLEKSKGENWHCDLLVLPEYGLTGLNPDLEHSAQFLPDINVTPNEYQDNIKALSNLAIKYKVNLVVNLLEFEAKKYYNALVVFDKLGRLKQNFKDT
ncbi:uncharacterized protein LOC109598862 isoform X2 [Aethina tumida]|uniref:uncharacterized protein LOC109598862 isoform X2 n=1 Tax=Aethina tumida TaxID=116153 RepID=UPI0021476F42|nr:uncharacterized protein LOC109598862 isoform X2 [Aethina tumida]